MNQLRQWVEAFTAREGRGPTDEEAIAGMEITAADLRILRQAAAVRRVGSLDALMGDDDSDSFITQVVAPPSPVGNTQRQVVLDALRPWPELCEILERRLAGQSSQEAGMAMGITRLAAERLSNRALAMAQRLVAAERQDDVGSVEALKVEIEIQLQLFPIAA
jgi:DNA-directed RNA polymerase specialized sigma subunit